MSNTMIDILAKLKAPFPADQISWRPGKISKDNKKGLALAYIDARDVMDRLDEVVGEWQDSYEEIAGRLVCKITINGITRTDGAGDTAIEGEKGGLSDAFKRAAVKWGIGRYLYRLPAQWVELDQYKQFKRIPSLPKWALPESNGHRANAEPQPEIDPRPPLIKRIEKAEKSLGEHGKARNNLRQKHLKTEDFHDPSIPLETLQKFFQHVADKFRDKRKAEEAAADQQAIEEVAAETSEAVQTVLDGIDGEQIAEPQADVMGRN